MRHQRVMPPQVPTISITPPIPSSETLQSPTGTLTSLTPIRWGNGPDNSNTPRSAVTVSTSSANTPLAAQSLTPPRKNIMATPATPTSGIGPATPPLSSRGYPPNSTNGRYLASPTPLHHEETLAHPFGQECRHPEAGEGERPCGTKTHGHCARSSHCVCTVIVVWRS